MQTPPVTKAFGTQELLRFDYARIVAKEPQAVDEFHQGVLDAIDRHGFAVIENAVDGTDCDRLVAEMRPSARRRGRAVGQRVALCHCRTHRRVLSPALGRLVRASTTRSTASGEAKGWRLRKLAQM